MKKDKEILSWARALYLALEESKNDEEKVIQNLIQSLDKKNYLIPAIIKKYKSIKEKENRVEVFIAKEITEDVREGIDKQIERLEGSGKSISYKVDEDLIGGFRIKTKDYLVKASIKDTLIKFKNNAYGHN